MNVIDIVANYLRENGYDGLYNPGVCACELSDLRPCDSEFAECKPGVKKSPDEMTEEEKELYDVDCEFYIVAKKEDKES